MGRDRNLHALFRMLASELGFCRIATGSPRIEIADPRANAERIVDLAREAHRLGASVLLLPELCLSGYTCEDLFHTTALLDACLAAIETIAWETRYADLLLVFGSPLRAPSGRIFNTALALAKGKVLAAVPKCHLPNYGEFYEKRWFAPGSGVAEAIRSPALGSFMLCANQLILLGPMRIGIEICEDLWAPLPPSTHLGLSGANVILNLSASNELVGKSDYRRDLVRGQSGRLGCAYAYVSCGPSESTKDIVYSGHALIAENGVILGEKRRFPFEDDLLLVDIDLGKISHERLHNTTFMWQRSSEAAPGEVPVGFSPKLGEISRGYSRTPFVPEDETELGDRAQEVFSIQASGLARRLIAARARTAQVGVSGGLDSTLALLVMIEAFRILRMPLPQIHAVSMPGYGTSAETRERASGLAKALGVGFREIEIGAAVGRHFLDIGHDPLARDLAYENAQARMRTLVLLDLANQESGIMVGTSDLSELALGWCTYNGDQISGYHVNVSVPKTLVRHLIAWYARCRADGAVGETLRAILEAPVNAELLPQEEGRAAPPTTEEVLGPYEFHDFALFHFVRNGFSSRKILYLAERAFGGTYSRRELKSWLRVFFKRFFANQFKRSCVPCGPKVGTVTLSPRGDWRMPDEASVDSYLREIEGDEKSEAAA